jgi:hypothetical protein
MIKRHDTRYRHFLVSLPKKKTSMKKNVNQTIIKSNVLAVSGCVIFEKKKKKSFFVLCFLFVPIIWFIQVVVIITTTTTTTTTTVCTSNI